MNRGLHAFAVVTAVATLFLIFAGGMVTSTGSGDAVPDWWFVPISWGTLFPRMEGGVLYEHGHRLIATAVGILTIMLAVWLARREPRLWVRTLGWVALAGVVAQGVLGGLRVLMVFDHDVMAVAHATVAQAFFCLTVVIAVVTGRRWASAGNPPPRLMTAAMAASAAAFLQLLLGAIARHTHMSINYHLAGAFVVTALAGWAAALGVGLLPRLSLAIMGLLFTQLALGFGAYAIVSSGFAHSMPTAAVHLAIVTGHVMVGAMLLAGCVTLAAHAARFEVARRAEAVKA